LETVKMIFAACPGEFPVCGLRAEQISVDVHREQLVKAAPIRSSGKSTIDALKSQMPALPTKQSVRRTLHRFGNCALIIGE